MFSLNLSHDYDKQYFNLIVSKTYMSYLLTHYRVESLNNHFLKKSNSKKAEKEKKSEEEEKKNPNPKEIFK